MVICVTERRERERVGGGGGGGGNNQPIPQRNTPIHQGVRMDKMVNAHVKEMDFCTRRNVGTNWVARSIFRQVFTGNELAKW